MIQQPASSNNVRDQGAPSPTGQGMAAAGTQNQEPAPPTTNGHGSALPFPLTQSTLSSAAQNEGVATPLTFAQVASQTQKKGAYPKRDKGDTSEKQENRHNGERNGRNGDGSSGQAPQNPGRHITPTPVPDTQGPSSNYAQDVQMEPELILGPAGDTAPANPGGYTAIDPPSNPHLRTTQMDGLPTLPPSLGMGYTGKVWPKTVITSADLFRGIRADVLATMLANPKQYLLILPYGAGRRLLKEFPHLKKVILDYLLAFRWPGCEGIDVIQIAAADGRPKPEMYTKDFEPPWLFALTNFTDDFKKFLLSIGTFDFTAWGWCLARPTQNKQGSVQECYAGRTDIVLASVDEMVDDALSTLNLEYTTDLVEGGTKQYWHLTVKPITDDDDLHKRWLDAIRLGKKFVVDGIKPADATRGFRRCDFCKNETHPESSCPFPRAVGWKGPSPKEVRGRWEKEDRKDEVRKEKGGSSTSERNRDYQSTRGRGRGGRGKRQGRNAPYWK